MSKRSDKVFKRKQRELRRAMVKAKRKKDHDKWLVKHKRLDALRAAHIQAVADQRFVQQYERFVPAIDHDAAARRYAGLARSYQRMFIQQHERGWDGPSDVNWKKEGF